MVASRIRLILDWEKKNPGLAIVLAVVLLSRIPFLLDIHAITLLNQDTNAEHFGRLFLNHDIPERDDSEVGENARTFSLVSVYFWLPLAFFQLGIPFEFLAGLHLLFVLPLATLGIYRLSISIFGDRHIAVLGILVFLVGDFLFFRLNLGYPLLLNRAHYYGDINVVPILFSLSAMLDRRHLASSVWIALLAICNPTSAVSLTACYLMFIILSGDLGRRTPGIMLSFVIIASAALLSYVFVKLAMPIQIPAPEAARELAILGNAHFHPHISNPVTFLLAQAIFVCGLSYAIFVERRADRMSTHAVQGSRPYCMSVAMLALYISYGWGAYWILFVTSPALALVFAPAKVFVIVALFLCPYLGHALYRSWQRLPMWTLVAVALLVLGFESKLLWTGRYLLVIAIFCFAVTVVSRYLPRAIERGQREHYRSLLFAALFLVLVSDFGWNATKIFRSGEVAVARAFYDIQLQIKDKTPASAFFIPFRYAGTTANPFGSFRNWPFRTYSRRGANLFWLAGRNIYYNSARRHALEVSSYAAFGVDLWDSAIAKARAERQANAFLYFTGIHIDGWRPRAESSPIWSTLAEPYDMLQRKVAAMNLDEFKIVAKALGATHILVSRDPGMGPELNGMLGNEYFAVVPVR